MPSRKAQRASDGRLSANRPRKRPPAPKTRLQQLLEGTLTVADLDDDEIMAGRCKDKNGRFSGRPPNTFPRAIHDALRREFHKRVDEKFQDGLDLALETLEDVMRTKHAAAPARVRAAEIWIERTRGKVPDKVEQTLEIKPFEDDIAGLLVDVPDTVVGSNVVPLKKKRRKTG